MNNKAPVFSIIIPVYKVEKYINDCMDSVVNQSFKDFEALVVDDCGGDNSIKIVEEYAKKDKRIKILRHEKNRGLAVARNTALDAAKGKYIVCLDSDDWMEPQCLQVIQAEFSLRNTTSIWFNSRKFFDDTKTFEKVPMYDQNDGYRTITPENIAAYADFTWIKAYTRESIQRYNIYWPEGLTFEDGEFYFKYFTMNPHTYVISDCLINYRHREGSIVRDVEKGKIHLDHIYTVVEHLKSFWIENGIYERYKYTMLKLLQNRVRMCRGRKYIKETQELSKKFIDNIDFPNDFEDFNPENYEKPLVSIVVPFYNVENYISECLDSLIYQTYHNLEIICVDDCGQDNSLGVVKKYLKQDKRIKLVRHKKNKGLGGARNTGLVKAEGKYIFFVDSDDRLREDCVEKVVDKLLETNLDTVWFKSSVWWEESKKYSDMFFFNYYDKYPESRMVLNDESLLKFPLYSWNKGYRRDFLIKNNLKWPENVFFEDVEFYFKTFIKSPEIYIIDEPLYIYRRRNDSIMSCSCREIEKAKHLYNAAYRVYEYLMDNHLLETYQKSFNKYILDVLNMYNAWPSFKKQLAPYMVEFLQKINFPEKYSDK